MVKVSLLCLLFISIGFSIIVYQYPSEALKDAIGIYNYSQINKIISSTASQLKVTNIEITIYECKNLIEFSDITGENYNIGGIYKDDFIIIQPFQILKKKKLLIKVLAHEILHYIIEKKYSPPTWFEEGFIEYTLNDIPEELDGTHKFYLLKFLKRIVNEDITPTYPSLNDRLFR